MYKGVSSMKNKKILGFSLIAIMLIACIVLVVLMMTGQQKDTYYGIMKNGNTIEKMVSEKDKKVEENVKLPSDTDVNVKKGDFVMIVKKEGMNSYSRVSKVSHDDIPHGLMMKIHDMGDMDMSH